ncbi:MAG: hypothetical protein ACXAC7_21520, partial [Candidatus Hodarchaeales archaeon]
MTSNNSSLIYYAHNKLIYNSPQEYYEIEYIRKHFPLSSIINPSIFTKRWNLIGLTKPEIMDECFSLIQKCDLIIFSSVNGFIAKGVYDEVKYAEVQNKIVVYFNALYNTLLTTYYLEIFNFLDWRLKYAKVNIVYSKPTVHNILTSKITNSLKELLKKNNHWLIWKERTDNILLAQLLTRNSLINKNQQTLIFVKTKNEIFNLDFQIKKLIKKDSLSKRTILSVLGKANLCIQAKTQGSLNNNNCKNCILKQKVLEIPESSFETMVEEIQSKNLPQQIENVKHLLKNSGCPYFFIL